MCIEACESVIMAQNDHMPIALLIFTPEDLSRERGPDHRPLRNSGNPVVSCVATDLRIADLNNLQPKPTLAQGRAPAQSLPAAGRAPAAVDGI